MKKVLCICFLLLILTGCNKFQPQETILDIYEELSQVDAREISVQLPEGGTVEVFGAEDAGKYYIYDDYEILLQTFQSGDLNQTFREISGYSKDKLTILQRQQGDAQRYDCVWTAAGEGTDIIVRTAVLDDGAYHYALTAIADEADAGNLEDVWNELFQSFSIKDTET